MRGGKVVQKLFTPLNAPDYGTYVSQFKPNLDCLYTGHAGSNGLKLIRQLSEYGLKGKFTDRRRLHADRRIGAAADGRGRRSAATHRLLVFGRSSTIRSTRSSSQTIQRDYKVDPGVYAAETYLCGEVLEHAAEGDQRQDRGQGRLHEGAAARRRCRRRSRGPISFDEFGNVVGNIYIRKVEKKDGKYVNTVVKTYPNVSQFWTYNKDEFLKNPVYSRDYPPAKNLE